MTAWTDLPGEFIVGVDRARSAQFDTATHMAALGAIRAGESYLAWCRYDTILVLCDRLFTPAGNSYITDGFADVVARVGREAAITRYQAELLVNEALCLRDRLPQVLATLREGITSRKQVQDIIARTNLVGDGDRLDPEDPESRPIIEVLDESIAGLLRNRAGSWSTAGLRDMVDRLVLGCDVDAVRERRREALDKRGVWTRTLADGTGEITGVMAAENIRIAATAVRALADAVCADDGRTRSQRSSDAMFALLTGTGFECLCGQDDCTATIPDPATASVGTEVVIHVVTDAATLAGASGPGWVDGHGVICDEHVRDLAARKDAVIRSVTPVRTPPTSIVAADRTTDDTDAGGISRTSHLAGPQPKSYAPEPEPEPEPAPDTARDGVVVVYPGSQPGDPYRPTASCVDFVRVRDGYCTEPGCTRSAFDADVDHVVEYDRVFPRQGGKTSSENLNAKCRAGHLFKTHGDWVDVQYRDADGRLVTEYVTREGFTIPGEAETLEDLFLNLRRIRFEQASQAPPSPRVIGPDRTPRPTTDRTAAKHARRRAERARNKERRESAQQAAGQKGSAEAAQSGPADGRHSEPPPF
ncbi:HNH endonuclease signature motif containing protein [Gordonia jinghuaiqii]|uniref:HNH endonuclease signature motif containing protein n=1 Tax=Gordonia jinghuaiqii TaxID=2758710 RepID=UPI001FD06184|nr:HNH endonuclease signature motif containing protein [Gordonia jinghuaiqii]